MNARDIAKEMFEALGFKVVDVVSGPDPELDAAWRAERGRMAAMTDDDVKRLWDAYDGCNSPLGFSGEAIHWELNERGHGEYCAV